MLLGGVDEPPVADRVARRQRLSQPRELRAAEDGGRVGGRAGECGAELRRLSLPRPAEALEGGHARARSGPRHVGQRCSAQPLNDVGRRRPKGRVTALWPCAEPATHRVRKTRAPDDCALEQRAEPPRAPAQAQVAKADPGRGGPRGRVVARSLLGGHLPILGRELELRHAELPHPPPPRHAPREKDEDGHAQRTERLTRALHGSASLRIRM